MRLARIIRRVMPTTPLRAGIPPIWDRPDPPASQKFEHTKRLSLEEKHFYFLDGSSPTYMLVNSEIAEGDLLEAFPAFITRFAYLFLSGFVLGAVGYLWGSKQQVPSINDFNAAVDRLQTEKKYFDTKYGLQDLKNNPWKLNSWPQIFPAHQAGEQTLSQSYSVREQSINAVRKANKEALAYWNGLYQRSKESLKSGHH